MEEEAHQRKIILGVVGREYCAWVGEELPMCNTTGHTHRARGAHQRKSTPPPTCPNSKPGAALYRTLNRAMSTTHIF